MSSKQIIALDAMGGDYGPQVVVPAAAAAAEQIKNAGFIFFGDEVRIKPHLDKAPALAKISEIHHTDRVISNDEKPSTALRTGRDSSMRLALDSVKNGQAQSAVSAGNTGALMATAKMVLKCLPGIHRPAIASVFPTVRGDTIMLDLGANLQCDAEVLVQFALLGAVYARAVKGIANPTVGLLNVGVEQVKGPEYLRTASTILTNVEMPGRFHGFVEGDDIPAGATDVVVTDGFTGNVALKVAEGVGAMTGQFLRESFHSSLLARLGGLLAHRALRRLKSRVDPRYYNGGMFLGLDGICVKSHGGMDSFGFSRAILVAANLVEKGYNERVAQEVERLMSQESFFSGLSSSTYGAA